MGKGEREGRKRKGGKGREGEREGETRYTNPSLLPAPLTDRYADSNTIQTMT